MGTARTRSQQRQEAETTRQSSQWKLLWTTEKGCTGSLQRQNTEMEELPWEAAERVQTSQLMNTVTEQVVEQKTETKQ